jgi:C_GCAxxG_C_C family probable redox protein
MNNSEKALGLFSGNFNCSQSVLAAIGPKIGVDKNTCFKIASGFGGGMGRQQRTCGAVTGAYMALGAAYFDPLNLESKNVVYELVNEFNNKFTKLHKTTICRELINCDYTTEEGRKYAENNKVFSTLCVKFVKDAVKIVDKILERRD